MGASEDILMKLSTVRPFLLSACFLLAVALVATLLSGCDGNHIIGDPPTCVELVTDECAPEVVAEFCDDCGLAYWDGHRDGYQTGRCSVDPCLPGCPTIIVGQPVVVCDEEPDEDCDVDVVETDTDTCDLTVPVGHRPIECRGKGHSSLECDKNCSEFDPICIPCDLQVLAQHCETVCTPDGMGGMTCIQTCYDRTGRRV